MDSYTLGLFANMYPGFEGDFRGIFIQRMVQDLESQGVLVKKAVKTSQSVTGYIPFIYQSARLARDPSLDIMQAEYIPHSSILPVLLRRKKCPLILKFHGDDARIFPFRNPFFLSITRAMIRRSDYILTSSEEIRNTLIPLGAAPEKISAVHTGVDTVFFSPRPQDSARRELGLTSQKTIFLFVGRIHPWKGVQEIISVARRSPDATFVFVGPGTIPDHPKNCLFIGSQLPEEIRAWYTAADCLLLPSYTEGFPTVIMEAFACGRPAIATRTGGCPEQVEPGKTGLLIPVRDIQALYDAVTWMADHVEERLQMGERARTVAVERFDHIRMTQKLMDIHRRFIEK